MKPIFKPATLVAALALGCAASSLALADTSSADVNQMHQDYMTSMGHMHEGMQKGMTNNNPDGAFAQGMLAHHGGAVEMAQIELKYGSDPQMRALAENVIKTQSAEIQLMKAWLAAHPQP